MLIGRSTHYTGVHSGTSKLTFAQDSTKYCQAFVSSKITDTIDFLATQLSARSMDVNTFAGVLRPLKNSFSCLGMLAPLLLAPTCKRMHTPPNT